MHRIGFCCKYVSKTGPVEDLNLRTTTVQWLNRQSQIAAGDRLWDIVRHNLRATLNLVTLVSELPDTQRMLRLGSDILPMYTHPVWGSFYKNAEVQRYITQGFYAIGTLARNDDVRLSFHPGQFCVLASDRPDVVENSIAELEYHVDMARMMGYGASWHDDGFKINVHIGGKLGPAGFGATVGRLSEAGRNLITVENDEMSYGLDSVLELKDVCAIVIDLHHHWIKSGEYISHDDPRIQQVVDSWRGVRPVMHYSQTKETVLEGHCQNTLPCLSTLLEGKHSRTKLRAHSDYIWNKAGVDHLRPFLNYFDCQVEAKQKNLASSLLANQLDMC